MKEQTNEREWKKGRLDRSEEGRTDGGEGGSKEGMNGGRTY